MKSARRDHFGLISLDKAVGEWSTGYCSQMSAVGMFTKTENAISQQSLFVPKAGRYAVFARHYLDSFRAMPTWSWGAQFKIYVTLRTHTGQVLRNHLSPRTQAGEEGVVWLPWERMWYASSFGIWDLPTGEIQVEFRSEGISLMGLQFLALLPILACKDYQVIMPPVEAEIAEGGWRRIRAGQALDYNDVAITGLATSEPGSVSRLNSRIPVSANWTVYCVVWTPGRFDQEVTISLGSRTTRDDVSLVVPRGRPEWSVNNLGSYLLSEGDFEVTFTYGSDNPEEPLAVDLLLAIPTEYLVWEV